MMTRADGPDQASCDTMSSLLRRLRFNYARLTRRLDKKWPIHVRIHQVKGDQAVTYDRRARTLIEENGEKTLDIYKEGDTLSVPYKYFSNRKDGKEEIELLKADRDVFIPVPTDINFKDIDPETFEEEEGFDEEKAEEDGESQLLEMEEAVDRIVDINEWRRYAENLYNENADTVETEDQESWWHENANYIGVGIMLVGAGIFAVMEAQGMAKMCSYVGENSKNIIPAVAVTGKSLKNKLRSKLEQ
jgi:hypothetical protein